MHRFKLDVDNESFVEEDDVDPQIQCTDLLDHTDAESNESFHPDDHGHDDQSQAMQSTAARPSTLQDASGRSPKAKPSAAPGLANALDILAKIRQLKALAPKAKEAKAEAKAVAAKAVAKAQQKVSRALEEEVGRAGQGSGSGAVFGAEWRVVM